MAWLSCVLTTEGRDRPEKSLELSPGDLLAECRLRPGANSKYVAACRGAAWLYVRLSEIRVLECSASTLGTSRRANGNLLCQSHNKRYQRFGAAFV